MLIELWERLRGYDKWTEADAAIVSFESVRKKLGVRALKRGSSSFSSDLLSWTDDRGKRHFGAFINQDISPLYQMLEGETIRICYDPANPDRYYNRKYFVHWVATIAKAIAALAIGGGFIAWRIWTIIAHHGR